MTTLNTNLKPLILALFLCSNAPQARAEKLSQYETFRLEIIIDTTSGCRYRPVINGVEMQWFEAVARVLDAGNIRKFTCYTKDHGEIGQRYTFNNIYIGSSMTSYGPWTVAEYEKAMANTK